MGRLIEPVPVRPTSGQKIRAVIAALLLCAASSSAHAGGTTASAPSPSAGLLWNRSGLPAVFPLQVKTRPGRDYVVTLVDHGTGDDVLAAYIEGGQFFRVLVPPGNFRLKFAEKGPQRRDPEVVDSMVRNGSFELPVPLTFETRGLDVKAGHIVDLLDHGPGQSANVTLKDQLICQSFRLGPPSLRYGYLAEDRVSEPGWDRRARTWPKRIGKRDRDFFGTRHKARHEPWPHIVPRFQMRTRYCDQVPLPHR